MSLNKHDTPFWGNEPAILLNNQYIFEIFPTPKMYYEQKINAITRLVILLSVLGFIFTMSVKFLWICLVTLVIIYFVGKRNDFSPSVAGYKIKKTEGFTSDGGFGKSQKAVLLNPETLQPFVKAEFEPVTSKNPLGNVLLTQIYDTPDRKAAAPSFNNEVYDDITSSTKKMIQDLNPTIKNTNKQLFGDLYEKFTLDQSMRNFYSTPNTKVSNDQGAFAQFLFGFMPSSHDSDAAGALQREKNSYRYTLY
jgi:hypothetical protein